MARVASAGFELEGGDGRYRLRGAVGFATARALLERGQRAFSAARDVEVDLAGVTATDSAGLAVLLTWVQEARAAGRALRFAALPAQLEALARLCAVEPLLVAAATAPRA